jgi:hypothetical protein
MTLPEGPEEAETDFYHYIHLISGDRKIGKTDLLSNFPDCFFIFGEPGGRSIRARKRWILSWDDFKTLVYWLCLRPDYCKTIHLDTGYMLYELCFSYMLRELNIDKPQDEDWGNAWKFVEKEFRDEHMKLLSSGFGLAITAHTETKHIKKGKLEYDKLCIQLGGQAGKFYNAFADIIIHYQYGTNGKREMAVRGDNTIEAGTRTKDNFLYTDGQPIITLPCDFTGQPDPGKLTFELYKAAFENRLKNPGATERGTQPILSSVVRKVRS